MITFLLLIVIFDLSVLLFSEDHAIGLSTFTIMAGLGGSLGYAMGGLDWGFLGGYKFQNKHWCKDEMTLSKRLLSNYMVM